MILEKIPEAVEGWGRSNQRRNHPKAEGKQTGEATVRCGKHREVEEAVGTEGEAGHGRGVGGWIRVAGRDGFLGIRRRLPRLCGSDDRMGAPFPSVLVLVLISRSLTVAQSRELLIFEK